MSKCIHCVTLQLEALVFVYVYIAVKLAEFSRLIFAVLRKRQSILFLSGQSAANVYQNRGSCLREIEIRE